MGGEATNYTELSNRVEKLRRQYQELRSVPRWEDEEITEARQLRHDLNQLAEQLQNAASAPDRYTVLSRHCVVMASSLDREIARARKKGTSPRTVPASGKAARRPRKRPAPAKKNPAKASTVAEPRYRKIPVTKVDKTTGKAVLRLIDTGPGTRPDEPADPAGHLYVQPGNSKSKKDAPRVVKHTLPKSSSINAEHSSARRRRKSKVIVVRDSGYIHTVSGGLPGLGRRR